METTAMAQLEMVEGKSSRRSFSSSVRIDMTPMVDLAFLLITFFIFTTSMSEPRAMKLTMPIEDRSPTPARESKVLTVLLDKNNTVFAYEGRFEDALEQQKIVRTNYNVTDGMGKLIREKQKQLAVVDKKEGKGALLFLIKPTKNASYKNIIDALDETTINNVKKFMVVDLSEEEKRFLEQMINEF
jgi:biopolymer transport protein ExbD